MRVGVWGDDYCEFNLGKSKNGIHFAAFVDDNQCCRLPVWFLDESGGKEWVLKRAIDARAVVNNSGTTLMTEPADPGSCKMIPSTQKTTMDQMLQ